MRRAATIALAALAALGLAGCSSEASAPEAPSVDAAPAAPDATHVDTERVVLGALQVTIAASGSIEARRVSEIGPEVPGRLVEVFVQVGDDIEQGAPLFRVDPVPYELALNEARAGLSLAQAEAANAFLEARRVAQLVERSAASDQQAQQIRTQAAVARARVEQADARVARAQRDLERTLVIARPVLMTSGALIFGLLPVVFSTSTGSEFRAPMAVITIGGLLTSTALTLVVVPVVYDLVDRATAGAQRATSRAAAAVARLRSGHTAGEGGR